MDPTPERLRLEPPGIPGPWSCYNPSDTAHSVANNPDGFLTATGKSPNNYPCQPNNAAWANMMTELGYAIAPPAFHPARTTGYGGFALSLQASYAHINADNSVTNSDGTSTQYWHQGTQGSKDPGTNSYRTSNDSPDSLLQIYTLNARKGLPFGFEINGALGWVANTSLWVGGADLHWALLEGYRTGFLGYLPDVSIGGGVRTLGGSPKFFLTTVGIDATISKPIALADSAVLTPYVGAQRLYIFADSTVVSLTPTVDPLQQCGWQGNDVPGNPSAPGNTSGTFTGQPVCKNKLSNGADNNSDFNNQVTYNSVRVERWRGIVGLTYRYEILYLGGEFAMDMEDPGAEGQFAIYGINGARQWTTSFEIGVFF